MQRVDGDDEETVWWSLQRTNVIGKSELTNETHLEKERI
jgi:hypothetical protein